MSETKEGMDVKTIISLIGTVIGFILNLAPGLNFYNVYKKKNDIKTIVQSVLFFNVLCSLLWTAYWYPQNVFVPCFSAAVGEILSLIWASLYMVLNSTSNVQSLMYSLTIYNSVILLFYILVQIGPNISGPIATVVNILTYIAPAQNILEVCKKGDYNLIPIASVASGLACASCWLIFGILQHDWNCIIPNGLGTTFSTINLIMWCVFYCKSGIPDKEKFKRLNEEEETEMQTQN